ncbi:hypothetical protein KCU90_g5560, partial [Aureobasidium melanogenum]
MAEPSHDANGPYVSVELYDYEDLKCTKAELDTARQEVERRYEDLSKCSLDNMTYAKAQLDQARQAERFRYENFERVHKRFIDPISRLVAARDGAATCSTDKVEDGTAISSLGPATKVRPRRIRVSTRAQAGPSRRVIRQTRVREIATAPVTQSRDPVVVSLASRASDNADFKALMKIVATGNASQEQLCIFQGHIDELTAQLNTDQTQSAVQIKSEHAE